MKKIFTFIAALMLTFAAQAATPVTLPAGVQAEDYTLTITYAISQNGGFVDTSKEFTTKVAFDGNDVYVAGLAYYFPTSYVKGTRSGNKVTFASGQFLGEDMYGEEYLSSYTLNGEEVVITDFVLNYNAQTRSLTYPGDVFIAETSASNGGGMYAYVKAATFTPGAVVRPEPVAVPDGLQTTDYLLICDYVVSEPDAQGNYHLVTESYNRPLAVGIDGDDLYIQGLVENVTGGWAKATKNAAGNYVIPKGQYIGSTISYGETFDYYLAAVNRSNALEAITLTLNTSNRSISTTQTVVVTRSPKNQEAYYWLKNITMKTITERTVEPAAPSFSFHAEKSPYGSTTWYYANIFVPLLDINGEPMVAEKVSYQFFRKKNGVTEPVTFLKSAYYMLEQDMSEIPYGFTDRLDIGLHFVYFEKQGIEELLSWSELGMQTIYRGGGVEKRSTITWFDMKNFIDGIDEVRQRPAAAPTAIYSLSGQRLTAPQKGLNIINGKKVLVK
jgi:hypothetical protein